MSDSVEQQEHDAQMLISAALDRRALRDPDAPTHVVVLLDAEDRRVKRILISVLGPMSEADAERAAARINAPDGQNLWFADVIEMSAFNPDTDLESLVSQLAGEDE